MVAHTGAGIRVVGKEYHSTGDAAPHTNNSKLVDIKYQPHKSPTHTLPDGYQRTKKFRNLFIAYILLSLSLED